jgi:acyl-coenzyme A thioesterase PaaI-like protein
MTERHAPLKIQDSEEEQAMLRLVHELRLLIEQSISLRASPAQIDALTEQLQAIKQRFEPHVSQPLLDRYQHGHATHTPHLALPYSPVSGPWNPLAPPLVMHNEGNKVIGTVHLAKAYEGPPGCVHGSIVAAIYDQVLAMANLANQTAGPTASLNIQYRKPTPLFTNLRYEAWVEKVDGRKIHTHGICMANNELVTECDGLFIVLQPEQARKLWGKDSTNAKRSAGQQDDNQ